jgi:hypothetical protein
MDDFITRIETAVKSGDTIEVKRIIHNLVVIGVCDKRRAEEILKVV